MPDLSRRTTLGMGAAALAASAVPSLVSSAQASVQPAGRQVPGIYRYNVGNFELTAINDGISVRPVAEGFVKNASVDDLKAALTTAFLPTDRLAIPYTQLVVNTGNRLVLIDTGTGGKLADTAGMLMENMQAAGLDPQAVDTILISHFHGDHILGLQTKDGKKAFPNAEIMVPAAEWAFWMDEGQRSRAPDGLKGAFDNVHKTFGPLLKEITQFEPEKELVPGITPHAAYGHTPGHTIFRVSSGSENMMALSDTTNHPALFVRHPQWHAVFDMDGNMAAETRRKVLDMVAADRMRIQGYHFPFPATGYIAKEGSGYEFVPAFWSPVL